VTFAKTELARKWSLGSQSKSFADFSKTWQKVFLQSKVACFRTSRGSVLAKDED
jgi:hypothetical protein